MLCPLTGLKDVTISIKKNYKVAVQLSINFSENWNFWNWDNCWNCGTHLCAEFWDKAKDDAESEAFSPRTHCSKSKFRLSSVLQCLAMNLPTFSSFQGMQNCRIWRLPYVVLLQCCSKGSIMSSMSVYLDKYFLTLWCIYDLWVQVWLAWIAEVRVVS